MKPVFFISSTIYDFADLRSSVKWWLEENEYLVNASEYNDFNKPLNKNSYEACLSATVAGVHRSGGNSNRFCDKFA